MGFLHISESTHGEQVSDNNNIGFAIRGLGERDQSSAWFRNMLGALVAGVLLLFSSVGKVHALGVGAAETDSYIGQRLSVSIPLFNVSNPNALSINFSSPQFGREGQSVVQAELDRSNSQLSIRLTSNSVVNEPYLEFSLELNDGGSAFNKDFTVLLDLEPGGASQSAQANVSSTFAGASDDFSVSNLTDEGGASSDLMGPYDYAQAGRIPARFGAVLDGQSLWRVARRINGAMGVSRSQMIWALYQANPGAFTAKSVQSLKAGSFLTIPDESVVKQVSHEQAKANLRALSSADSTRVVAESSAIDTSALAEFSETDSDDGAASGSAAEQVQANPFQVTSVGELGAPLDADSSKQAQEIIVSLTETVGNLSQQLIRKDGQIESLEAQVAELKSFISDDANLTLSTDVSAPDSGANLGGEVSEQVSEVALQNPVTESGAVDAANDASVVTTVAENTRAALSEARPIWHWLLLAFALLLIVALFLRTRIAELWRSLNLFGSDDRVEFNDQVAVEMPKVYSRDQAAFDSAPTPPFQPVSANAQSGDGNASKDYSKLVAVEKTDPEGSLAGISYSELGDDDGSFEPNDVLEFVTEESGEVSVEVEDEDLSFDDRFNSLLEDNDFDFARELLDFARYNEINDERYHFERLRLFEKMRDEDGFYQYYYEIEEQIPSFPQTVQTEISQLVVQLAHH